MESQAGQLAYIRGNFAYTRNYRRKYRRITGHASLAPQDDAQKIQVRFAADSVSSDSPHIFHKQIRDMVDYGLKDRVALLTGANNPQGIGATTAFAFAREGA